MKWTNLRLQIHFHIIIFAKHDSVEIIYGNKLVEDGVISKEQMEDVMDKVQKRNACCSRQN